VPDFTDEACTCPYLRLGSEILEARNWVPGCAQHGVGTEHFRAMSPKPFGFAGEAETAREEWLDYVRQSGEIVITREQQEDLDPILGKVYLRWGKEAADLVMAAYRLGRKHA